MDCVLLQTETAGRCGSFCRSKSTSARPVSGDIPPASLLDILLATKQADKQVSKTKERRTGRTPNTDRGCRGSARRGPIRWPHLSYWVID